MLKYFHSWNCVFEGLPKPFWALYNNLSDLQYAWEKAGIKELSAKGLYGPYLHNFIEFKKSGLPFKSFEDLNNHGIKAFYFRDKDYPKILRDLNNHLPPAILYIKGALPQNHTYLSVVGTRDLSSYGEQVTQSLLKQMAGYDICIVSGLARGIDTLAHSNAIQNKLPTVAVLGYGHQNVPYYVSNLCKRIIEEGAVISEYPPYLKAQKYYFPLRNRIISGLSGATLVIEAGERSGALITANYALDQGREVMAIPGNIYQEKSMGTNRFIGESSAHLVRNIDEILFILGVNKKDNKIPAVSSINQKNILKALAAVPLSRSELLKKTKLSPQNINVALTELEIEHHIKKNRSGNYYIIY